jgi:hypothetical protein
VDSSWISPPSHHGCTTTLLPLTDLCKVFQPRRPGFESASGHKGFVVDKVTGFLRVLRFPQPIFIPPIAPQSLSSIIWASYNRPVVAALSRGLSHPTKMFGEKLVNLQLMVTTVMQTRFYLSWTPLSRGHNTIYSCTYKLPL